MASVKGPSADIKHVFRGTFIHSTQKAPLQILEDSLLGVDAEGKVSSDLNQPFELVLLLSLLLLLLSVRIREFAKLPRAKLPKHLRNSPHDVALRSVAEHL